MRLDILRLCVEWQAKGIQFGQSDRTQTEDLRRMLMAALPDNGMVHLHSPYSVPDTLKRLESVLQAKGVNVFALVDHSGEAAKVGLKMHPTQLIIFGSPKAGTPLMVASPTLAIDLPLKALAWEDADGRVWLSYNSPEYLKQRHNIPDDLVKNIAVVGPLLEKAIE
jgi:uncharacterized protein (DUF302 family)